MGLGLGLGACVVRACCVKPGVSGRRSCEVRKLTTTPQKPRRERSRVRRAYSSIWLGIGLELAHLVARDRVRASPNPG